MIFRKLLIPLLFIFSINIIFSATNYCNNCSDCTLKINSSSAGDIIYLNSSIDVNLTSGSACIDFDSYDNFVFDCQSYSNYIKGNLTGYGIDIPGGTNNITVKNCNISNFDYGLWTHNTAYYQTFENNLFSKNNYGIYLYTIYNSTIRNNRFENNSAQGIYLFAYRDSSFSNNIVTGNSGTGVYCRTSCDRSIFSNNNISSNGGNGLTLLGTDFAKVLNNIFTFNSRGLHIESFGTYAEDNIMKNNYRGVEFARNGDNSTILNNLIYNNSNAEIYFYYDSSGVPENNSFSGNKIYNHTKINANIDWNNLSSTFSSNYYYLYNGTNGPICFSGINPICDSNPLVIGSNLETSGKSVFPVFNLFNIILIMFFTISYLLLN